MGCLLPGSTQGPTQPTAAVPSAAGPLQRRGQSNSTGRVHPPKNCSLGPPDLHVLVCRGPSSCPETEPALPMSLLSPSYWPGQAGDGFGARGYYGDIWPALVLLRSVWEHCKLEIPEAIHQLRTSTCINKSSVLLSPGTGPYHHAQHFQQHPACQHSCTGELPSPWIRLTCTPPCSQHLPGRSWATHQNMHRVGSLIVVSSCSRL